MNLPNLPNIENAILRWWPLDNTERSALADLIKQMERVDNPPYRTSEEELEELFSSQFVGIGGWDADGAMGAYALVHVQGDEPVQLVCSGGVAPRWRLRGIGRAVLEWEITVAGMIAGQIGKDCEIVSYTDNNSSSLEGFMASVGFTKDHVYTELRRPLQQIPELVEPGPYLSIVPWQADYDDQVRRAHNELMSFISGEPPMDATTWENSRENFAPQWSFVALDKSSDRSQVAGYLLSASYDQDWHERGWKEGYTEILGVLPQWSQTQVAKALLTSALAAYYADSMQYAAVGLDAKNNTAAQELYEQMGYRVAGLSTRWVISIPNPDMQSAPQ